MEVALTGMAPLLLADLQVSLAFYRDVREFEVAGTRD